MSEFRRYDHVERLGHDEVDGLTLGKVHVFPKLDGCNCSVWMDADGVLRAGSRNRELDSESDHAGFHAWMTERRLAWAHLLGAGRREWIVYGEWMVPHTLKTYRQEVWRDFWVFDVWDRAANRYLSFDEYAPAIRDVGFRVVDPLCVFTDPSEEQLRGEVERNTYLIEDGAGLGEGIVLKNYEWRNRFGRQPWAKIVRNEFKEDNRRAFGAPEKDGEFQVEAAIAERYVTATLVQKTRAKIVADLMDKHGAPSAGSGEGARRQVEEHHRKTMIPRLLDTVFYELVREELWDALKEHRLPTVDFKKLKAHSIRWTKKFASDLF